ncbi:MAG TPA: hypothetical protein VGH34_21370 [Vicinamibacterales bacterium]
MSRAAIAVVLFAAGVGLTASQNHDFDPRFRDVLVRDLAFSPSDLADLSRGKPVRHSIPSRTAGEIAAVGAVRVYAPKAAFLTRVRDITRFKQGQGVLEIGRFSDPPVAADLAALTVDASDFDARVCRVGDCGVRLPADVIKRVQQEIDLRLPDVQARTSAFFKQALFDDVSAYATGGPGRFAQYDDGAKPIRPIDAFNGILQASPSIGALAPELPDHLQHFPAGTIAGAEDFLYWSKEKYGIAPFISVTHVTIVCPSAEICVMTTKDVYSSRYIDASLATVIASDVPGSADAFDLVYATRSRVSALDGFLSSFRRSMVERKMRGGLEDNLKLIKAELESGR